METDPSAARTPLAHLPAPLPVMALLQDHLPLTLLLDLAWGVSSSEVYAAESADLSWLRPSAVA